MEDQVSTSGPGMALIYQMLIPLFWCIPIALVASELTTAMPVQGGFYRWTRAAFGDMWGFLAGWWNWLTSFFLGGAYAALLADYAAPQVAHWKHYCIAVFAILIITYVNVRGIQMTGRLAIVAELAILAIVFAMCVMSVRVWTYNPFVPVVAPHKSIFQVFGVGFAIGLWLYAGYEQLSSVAEEIENPQRNYPRALAWVVPLSILTYVLPTICSLAVMGHWDRWHDGTFSDAAMLIGGWRLRLAITLAAGVMSLATLNSTVLSATRMPFAMAQDGYLPAALTRIHRKFGTPWISILLSAGAYCLLSWFPFAELISIYVWLRVATSVMTVLSAWQLRRKHPDLQRTFRIPWGRKGLAYAVIAPLMMSGIAIITSDKLAREWGPILLLSGPAAYFLRLSIPKTLPSDS